MNSITLTYGSTTQSLDAWGFTYCTLHLKSRAAAVLILDRGGEQPEAAPIIPYGGQITLAVAMGDGSTYYWKGKRRDFNGQAHPDAPRTSMQFEDVWGALERTTFQHFWKMNGGSGVTDVYFSRLNLFQDISAGPGVAWTYLDAHDQIVQIIDFAQTNCSLPVQCGTVDPVWNMPVFAVKAISCAYALQLVMKPMPDMVTAMDYSTTPPTIHFRQRQNCTPITLPYGGSDANHRHHKQTQIKPRPDLQVPAVVIQYQITGTVDGAEYNDTSVDAFPATATGLEENALVFPVDLRGPSRTNVKGTLVTEAVDPATVAFWKEHKPDLNDANIVFYATHPIVDTTINTGSADGIEILDSSGAYVELSDYPNKLISGQPAQWMISPDGVTPVEAVEAVEVTIRATLRYVKNNPSTAGSTLHNVSRHVVEARIRLCDAPLGTTNYSVTGSSDSGDPIPFGLAYFIWCSINNVAPVFVDGVVTPPGVTPAITSPDNFQWEGEHEIVENTIYSIVTPANVLNLSGGNADWESMDAVIYGVDIDFFQGRTTINFGPFKHLQAAEYFEMVMAFRYRQVFDNPNLRNTGQASAGSSTDLGNNSPKENTTEQLPDHSLHTTFSLPDGDGDVVTIQQDANSNGGQIGLQTLDNTGAVDDTKPLVQLAQNDLGTIDDAGSIGREAKWRKMVCLDTSGNPKQFVVAASDAEDTSVDVGGVVATRWFLYTYPGTGTFEMFANYFIGCNTTTGAVSTICTFGSGATTITVASATNIVVGAFIVCAGIPSGATVTNISGTTITISAATTGAETSASALFYGLVRIAKTAKLRNSITSETIDGTTFSYTYGASSPYTYVARLASATISGSSYSEYQVVVPRYLDKDEVWAMEVNNSDIGGIVAVSDLIASLGGPGSGTPITLLDLNLDGRAWAASANQSGYE